LRTVTADPQEIDGLHSAQSDSLQALAHRQPAQGSLTLGPVEQDVATAFDSGR
jgi:hypothetical protein